MVKPPELDRITVDEAVNRFLDRVAARVSIGQRSSQTHETYRRALESFVALVGADRVLDDVTGGDVDAVLAGFARTPDRRFAEKPGFNAPVGKSADSQQLFYRVLDQLFADAVKHGWVQASPMDYAELRPGKSKQLSAHRRALTIEQADALLLHGAGAVQADTPAKAVHNITRDRLLFTILAILGPRVSEVVQADVEDFVPQGSEGEAIWTVVGKGQKPRRLPLSADLHTQFREYQQLRSQLVSDAVLPEDTDSKAAFVSSRGQRLNERAIQRALSSAQHRLAANPDTAALARGITPHALRHTAATVMLASGWDVKVVAGMLGHDNIATTSRYLDEIPGELATALRDHPLLGRMTAM